MTLPSPPARQAGPVLQLLGPSTGGIRRHVASLSSHLRARGWAVSVAGPEGVMAGVGPQDHVVPLDMRLPDLLAGRRALHRLVNEAGFALVHAHGLKAGWLAAVSGLSCPLVLTVHNVVLGAGGPSAVVLRRLERSLPGRMDRVVAVSLDTARRLPGRVAVIAPVAPVPRADRSGDDVRAGYGIAGDQPLVVTVARLHPQKDLPNLLRAARVVRDDFPTARFVVVGEGPEHDRLLRAAEDLGVADVVIFAGPRSNPADELAAADVVVLPSRWEGSPLVVTEALLLGRPVVATSVGAVPEIIVDGRTGRLVPPADSAALARAIIDVLADRDRAQELAQAGLRLARERFDPRHLVDAIEDLYSGLVRR